MNVRIPSVPPAAPFAGVGGDCGAEKAGEDDSDGIAIGLEGAGGGFEENGSAHEGEERAEGKQPESGEGAGEENAARVEEDAVQGGGGGEAS